MEGRVPCGSKALKCKHLSPASFCEVAARAFVIHSPKGTSGFALRV